MTTKKKYHVGITFGAYDPVHYGHIKLFERAKKYCDILVVCVSDKQYIQSHKKRQQRIPYAERIKAVGAIEYVDRIFIQSMEIGKKEAIEFFKPDVIFVGNDWTPETYTGQNLGVPVIYLPYTKGISSTQLWGDTGTNK